MERTNEKRKVDFSTARSRSGRINLSLNDSSAEVSLRELPRTRSAPPASLAGNTQVVATRKFSLSDDWMGNAHSTDRIQRMEENGHSTDKTQSMEVSSRTMDVFMVESEMCQDDDESSESSDTSTQRKGTVCISRFRVACGKVVSNTKFQTFIVVLIIINAIMMGIGTFDFVTEDPPIMSTFEKTDLAFLIIFTIELAIQFSYHGLSLFLDGWLVFDFVIVLVSWSLSGLQIIRAFRVFRALRLITRLEVLRKLVTALMDVMPRMCAIGTLLLLLFYIFAVMFTVLFKDLYENGQTEGDYFSSLSITLFTLLQWMTMDFALITREVQAVYHWAPIPIVVFIMMSGFIVYNLIIAVVCDAVAMVEHENDDDIEGGLEMDEMKAESAGNSGEIMQRYNDLCDQVRVLIRNQREMQDIIQRLVKRLQENESQRTSTKGNAECNEAPGVYLQRISRVKPADLPPTGKASVTRKVYSQNSQSVGQSSASLSISLLDLMVDEGYAAGEETSVQKTTEATEESDSESQCIPQAEPDAALQHIPQADDNRKVGSLNSLSVGHASTSSSRSLLDRMVDAGFATDRGVSAEMKEEATEVQSSDLQYVSEDEPATGMEHIPQADDTVRISSQNSRSVGQASTNSSRSLLDRMVDAGCGADRGASVKTKVEAAEELGSDMRCISQASYPSETVQQIPQADGMLRVASQNSKSVGQASASSSISLLDLMVDGGCGASGSSGNLHESNSQSSS